jgi:hypothetical protein
MPPHQFPLSLPLSLSLSLLVSKSKVKALLPYMASLAGDVYPGFQLSEREMETGNKLCSRIVQVTVLSFVLKFIMHSV